MRWPGVGGLLEVVGVVGRREVPVDPGAGPVQRFAFELRKLRAEAGGITYRVMAQRAGYSAPTLSEAAAGEQLPTLAVVLAYVQACGGDQGEWQARWYRVSEELAARADQDDEGADSPYRGLARFETGDSEWFFGRNQLTADLLDLLRRRRFAAVFGPSGSGKSSLLRAGLIPALRHTQEAGLRPASIRILTPGENPARTHAFLLTSTDTSPGDAGADTLVIVDQFEEVFTLCQDPAERARFIDLLLATRQPDSRLRVLIAVRADFYGHCAGHQQFAEALRDANVLVGPMSSMELREAIVRPATAAGLTVERALTSRLIEEVTDAPGGLPLLSHVLLEIWRRRRGKTLTMAGYEAAGGLDGAIAKTAEDAYTSLTPRQADLARSILLRLITPGEGTLDTRRPVARRELDGLPEPKQTALVFEHLARARLLTLDDDTVDLVHEALITSWPRLREWVDEDRARLRVHRHLTEAAQTWFGLGKDSGALYRGIRLTAAEETFTLDRRGHLTTVERDFLTASITTREKDQLSRIRTSKRLRLLTAALSVFLVMALAAAGLVYSQRQDLLVAQRKTLSRQLAAQSIALRTTDSDLAALLAVQAYRTSHTNEAAAALYTAAVNPLQRTIRLHGNEESVVFSPDGKTVATYGQYSGMRLINTITGRIATTFPDLIDARVDSVSFSSSGHELVAAGEHPGDSIDSIDSIDLGVREHRISVLNAKTGRLRTGLLNAARFAFSVVTQGRVLALDGGGKVWDVVGEKHISTLQQYSPLRGQSEVSPDGRILVSVDRGGMVRTWNLLEGNHPIHAFSIPNFDAARPIAFSADGRTLATAGRNGAVHLWDTESGHRRITVETREPSLVKLTLSSNGQTLATASSDYTIRLWSVNSSTARAILTGHTGAVTSMAFSPDGDVLATVSNQDDTLRLWRVPPPAQEPISLFSGRVNATALSPDGRLLAIAQDDITPHKLTSTMELWDLATHRKKILSTGRYLSFLTLSPDGRTLAEQGWQSPDVVLRDIASKQTRKTFSADTALAAAFSPNGEMFALVSLAGEATIWKIDTGKPLVAIGAIGRHASAIAFSPDSRHVAVNDGNTTYLRDVRTRAIETKFSIQDDPTSPSASLVTFSPDGHTLATASQKTVRLWDSSTGHLKTELRTPANTTSMTFSPDGRTLATAAENGITLLWDTSTASMRATFAAATPAVAMAFSSDGRTLTTEHRDHTLLIRDTDLPDLTATLKQICQAVGRDLTSHEQSLYIPSPYPRQSCR